MADTFQRYCREGFVITKRADNHAVLAYDNADGSAGRLADKYADEIIAAEATKRMRTTRIKLTAIYSDIPTAIYLDQFLLLRTCKKVGDIEVVNNYQLGKLNEAKRNGQIDFIKL